MDSGWQRSFAYYKSIVSTQMSTTQTQTEGDKPMKAQVFRFSLFLLIGCSLLAPNRAIAISGVSDVNCPKVPSPAFISWRDRAIASFARWGTSRCSYWYWIMWRRESTHRAYGVGFRCGTLRESAWDVETGENIDT